MRVAGPFGMPVPDYPPLIRLHLPLIEPDVGFPASGSRTRLNRSPTAGSVAFAEVVSGPTSRADTSWNTARIQADRHIAQAASPSRRSVREQAYGRRLHHAVADRRYAQRPLFPFEGRYPPGLFESRAFVSTLRHVHLGKLTVCRAFMITLSHSHPARYRAVATSLITPAIDEQPLPPRPSSGSRAPGNAP